MTLVAKDHEVEALPTGIAGDDGFDRCPAMFLGNQWAHQALLSKAFGVKMEIRALLSIIMSLK